MKECHIETEYIKLDQLLKLVNIASTGGHAKIIIRDGLVKVNGESCMQRGKKIRNGDIVSIEDLGEFRVKSSS